VREHGVTIVEHDRVRSSTDAGVGHGPAACRYGLYEFELDALPARLMLSSGEAGMGVVMRDRGRLVGFKMIGRSDLDAAGGLAAARLLDEEVREAVAIERLRAELGPPADAAPTLTVAICSKDHWNWVERLLASLEPLRGEEPFEVLVVDNASSDDRTRAVCATRDWVRYVREPLVGLDFARNRAIREATGEVVAFLDDDVVVDRDWLRGMSRAWAENPDAGCVTGLVLPMALETEAQVLFELRGGFRRGFRPMRYGRKRHRDRHHPAGSGRFGAGANMSVRRELVLRLGGFDEALDTGRPLPGGGDLDIFYRVLRAGSVLIYEPQAAVYHEHRRELPVLRRQYYSWGLGFVAYVTKSMRTDPEMRPQFRRLLAWWFTYQARRTVARLRGREPTPVPMIFAEIWGGIVGLCGEYRRSERRSAGIRASGMSAST